MLVTALFSAGPISNLSLTTLWGQLELMHFFSLKKLGHLPLLAVLWTSTVIANEFQKGIDAFNNDDYSMVSGEILKAKMLGREWLAEFENTATID